MKRNATDILAVPGKGHQRLVGGHVVYLGGVIAAGGGKA